LETYLATSGEQIMANYQGGYNSAPQYDGLNIQGANQAGPLTSKEKVPLFAYICVAVIAELAGIVDLVLHYWIWYCGVKFSLTNAYDGPFKMSLSSLADDCVSGYSSEDCGDICTNIKHLRDAGNVMEWLGALAIVFTGISVFCMVLLVFIPKRFLVILTKVLLSMGMMMWVIGTVVYIGLFAEVSNNATNETRVFPGLGLAIANAALHVVTCLLGYMAASRLALRQHS